MSIRVMVVDDDDNIREILKVMLKDYEVIEAASGYEAIKMYEKYKPDIVFMDIMMPDVDGVLATKEILKMDPKAVIIGITAFARSKGSDLIAAGAKEVVEKPFTRKKLKAIIHKYVPAAVIG